MTRHGAAQSGLGSGGHAGPIERLRCRRLPCGRRDGEQRAQAPAPLNRRGQNLSGSSRWDELGAMKYARPRRRKHVATTCGLPRSRGSCVIGLSRSRGFGASGLSRPRGSWRKLCLFRGGRKHSRQGNGACAPAVPPGGAVFPADGDRNAELPNANKSAFRASSAMR